MRLKKVRDYALPERMSAIDGTTYREPVWVGAWYQNYQTFWDGNQLPGFYYSNLNPTFAYSRPANTQLNAPQLAGGTFAGSLSVESFRQLAAAFTAAWQGQG